MKILGIDYGDARTGIAISDEMKIIAQSYGTIYNKDIDDLMFQLEKVFCDNQIETVVIGYPKNMNGTVGERGEKSKQLSQLIEDKFLVKTILIDERLTTVSAHRLLSEANVRGKKRKKVVDSVSATFILQSYLDSMC